MLFVEAGIVVERRLAQRAEQGLRRPEGVRLSLAKLKQGLEAWVQSHGEHGWQEFVQQDHGAVPESREALVAEVRVEVLSQAQGQQSGGLADEHIHQPLGLHLHRGNPEELTSAAGAGAEPLLIIEALLAGKHKAIVLGQ
jgi:hypothetical protein